MAAGEYEIGRETGRLLVRTYRQGLAAKVGHDLLIEATRWEGHVVVPADSAARPTVSVRMDTGALEVVEGTGGVNPLSEGDRQQIQRTMRKMLRTDRYPHVAFTSTAVELRDDSATVDGDLTLTGQTHPQRLEIEQRDEATLVGTASLVQSRWGVKPYSGFLGALKLRDAVDIEFTVSLSAH
ncbi:polyisoprenoid-binding protein [Streptomyces camponoticapitis]|uniref:Polyisoprenoid-binding protein n=1 Tax=Streptomyces camponoticapitis TaxID=1616125 RepID=A0ABQ2ETW1_9ACTN|nr:YceI family protein [Streptomyces camponoticapitis]GGK21669.1 polyisoprenoid-binding protein [Streptomyces camponoticapitis]